jgi:uncharacterized membrane protein
MTATRPYASSAAIVVLAAWLGAALFVAAIVAPAAFAALPSRALSGELIGRILPPLFYAGIVTSLATIVLQLRMASRTTHVLPTAIVAAACAASQLLVAPRIARLREALTGPLDALAAGDPQRLAFGRLHGLSVGLLAVAMAAAAFALVVLARRASSLTSLRSQPAA